MPRKKVAPPPAAPESRDQFPYPGQFGFHQLEGDELLFEHCGPTAIRVASGRDDLSVLDCAIPAMRSGLREIKMGADTALPGRFYLKSVEGVLKDKLGFEPVEGLGGRSILSAIDELNKKGYTHGTIGMKGHIIGFRDGVIYDVEDPRDDIGNYYVEVTNVLAAKEAPGADRQAMLDAEIADVRASGEAREFCLLSLAKKEDKLARLMARESAGVSPVAVRDAVDAVARWRHYCATGNIAPDRVVCEQQMQAIQPELDALQSTPTLSDLQKRQLRSLQAKMTVWQTRCDEAALEAADLCQHRKNNAAANLAYVNEKIARGDASDDLERDLRVKAQIETELANWERLCETDLSKPYKPPKKTYFDPVAPVRRVAAKPKATAKEVKPKAPAVKKGAAPARRRSTRKEPAVAGVLPQVTIANS